MLEVANSIFKKYRSEYKSEKLWTEIAYALQHFAAPLLALFQRTLQAVQVSFPAFRAVGGLDASECHRH